eukprot:CAMPEP_0113312092 /NCGR_PEP_ID=MMETSP0010_2-20120614/9055_1 /TAXON_ID=216773 ORGANISM="Corethron hystrix, Strain 308" /NCGR_SAMPLE_ID=MMETSP0010_2 /ASSEMBLY_ACC=CAM_ASM_000155 /LENGTH=458 /DNA_ID=CAMNT_0000167837 /DNA_START=56 /DNA_END=1432 /DNA_ORIENTATION=- /assembly_acc=CAM_ASM_000155
MVALALYGLSTLIVASAFVPSGKPAFSYHTKSSSTSISMKFEYADEYEKSSKDIRLTKNHTDLLTDGLRIAPPPYSVEGREGLTGSVMVSGFLEGADRSDQIVFDMLHTSEGMKFEKIIALCEDDKMAKKRLVSRSARYSGLLDVLSFVQSFSALPSASELEGVNTWVARVSAEVSTVESVASLASEASISNLVLLIEGSATPEDAQTMHDALTDTDVDFTVLNYESMVDGPEGEVPFKFGNATDTAEIVGSVINKDELMRIMAVSLSMEKTKGRSLNLKNVASDDSGAIWLRALRQKGFSRIQEVDALIGGYVDVPYYERARDAQIKFKGIREGSVKLSPEELAIKAAADKRSQRKQRIETMKREIKERQEDIIKRAFKALKLAYNDRKYAGKGGMDEDVYNRNNFENALEDAIRMWDSSVNGKKNRQSYHTDADTTWIPQMLEKYGKKKKKSAVPE